ncbi:MAG: permease [Candidatus Dormibacteraeota bacterium]|nr:permease [Candidatus Dormibacteraeota bacterium]
MLAVHVLEMVGAGLREALAMVWDTLWALTLGFLLSGGVQAFVSRREMSSALGRPGLLSLTRAAGFGAVSSSCSYAASAMAKSLFAKGADFVAAMVFMFASTNLVVELGVVLAVLIGWQFTASEFVGGLLMIALLALVARVFFPQPLLERARSRLNGGPAAVEEGASCAAPPPAPDPLEAGWRARIRTRAGWSDAAGYAAADLTMLRRELAIGFLVAGFLAALVPSSAWQALFWTGHGFWSSLENAVIGPFIAIISFVCSIGNVPLAAALWKGGISFGGVVSFVFADLISMPLLLIYRRFYGWRLALRMLLAFWVVMSAAGLLVQYLFQAVGIAPPGRPTQLVSDAFALNYTSSLDLLAVMALAAIFWQYRRRRAAGGSAGYAIDPICGMQVEIANAPATLVLQGRTIYFCSDRCRDRMAAETGSPAKGGTHMPDAAPRGDSLPTVDPVCGMEVDPEHASATLNHDGATYYFCALSCRDRFAADPGHFLRPRPASERVVDPVCGMEIDAATAAASFQLAGVTHYFCSEGCSAEFQRRLAAAAGLAGAGGAAGA